MINTRHTMPLREAIDAMREEAATEAVVAVVGTAEAQQAVYEGRLPQLVDSVSGDTS